MQVERPAGYVVKDCGHLGFDRGNVFAHLAVVFVLVDAPGGLQHQQPELLDLDPGVGYFPGPSVVGQDFALGFARQYPLAHQIERFLTWPMVRMAW